MINYNILLIWEIATYSLRPKAYNAPLVHHGRALHFVHRNKFPEYMATIFIYKWRNLQKFETKKTFQIIKDVLISLKSPNHIETENTKSIMVLVTAALLTPEQAR